MPRPKSDLLSKLGIMFEILKALVGGVLEVGGNDEDLRRLETDPNLRKAVAKLIVGKKTRVSQKKPKSLYVNLAKDPVIPDGFKLKSHQRGGKRVKVELIDGELYLDGKKIILYLSERQQNGQTMTGYELREELSGKQIINANLLDFLLDHPELIPEKWKKDVYNNTIFIFFWGTEYEVSPGYLCVRSLYSYGAWWHWRANRLSGLWYGYGPAALAAN